MAGRLPPLPRSVDPSEQPPLRLVGPSDAADCAVLRIRCSGEGFAEARSFTRDTLHCWSLDQHSDDAALVITELAANAVAHAVPRLPARETEVWLGLLLDPAHVMLTVSDSGDNLPEHPAIDGSDLREHGRGLCIVDALAEEWGWALTPPAGKTVWARLSTCPSP